MGFVIVAAVIVGFMIGALVARAHAPRKKEQPRDMMAGALRSAFDSARRVIQYAVGNLDPRIVRGWPYEDLDNFSRNLRQLRGHDQFTVELCDELDRFVIEAREMEESRGPQRRGFHGQLLVSPEPLTGEAAEVWDRAMKHMAVTHGEKPEPLPLPLPPVSGEVDTK